MNCGICGKSAHQQKEGMCLRCYVMSHAIRLEPEMPRWIVLADGKGVIMRHHTPVPLKLLIVDVNTQTDSTRC